MNTSPQPKCVVITILQILAPIVFGLTAAYIPSFFLALRQESKVEVLDDRLDFVVEETTVNGDSTSRADKDGEEGSDPVVSQKIAVQETIIIRPKPMHPLKSFLLGTPNSRSLVLSVLAVLINIHCALLVADRLYSEHYETAEDLSFVRVGFVSPTEAKLLIREPDQTKMPVTVQIHIKEPQAPFDNPLWQTAGGVKWTNEETDFTAVLRIPLRHSAQRTYEWTSSNNHSGEFTAPPKPGHVSTLNGGKFTFLSTSCIVSRLPYSPFDHPLAIPGMRYLTELLPSLNAQFMLFLGDFIYIDVPRMWGAHKTDYRQKYRQVYASPDWAGVGQNLSWIHVLDDHEILNDWSSNNTGVYAEAVDPWHHYHTSANPPLSRQAGSTGARKGATWFEFTQGPASFFMMDTRSYRSSNQLPARKVEKTMLGQEQLEDLLAYLARPEPKGVKWKILASSVPFTKNWRVNTKDTWGGFLHERNALLHAMWNVGKTGVGVVILSGDRHEFAATKFPPPDDTEWPESSAVHEFSVSPLSQFYSPIPTYRQTDGEDVKIK
jgi:alkaline phosphatase D